MPDQLKAASATFLNPVYPHSFPDPFVMKFSGEYFAYATGFAADGRVFPVLRSRDLVNWQEVGSAMDPLPGSPPYYWAPEVFYDNGKFYLYYSAGNEVLMEIRVAVSERPEGGFVDSGVRLTREDFAIDAHVFIDDDGARYLFYATDFLTHSHIGTGTVMDEMIDWFTLKGDPKPVTRAKYDWQVYDPNRREKGGVRWHTVEGPAVIKRKQKYYEMFSGGNWQNVSYGVSFAISESIERDDEWLQYSDGVNTLPILRTIPDIVIGPGHNCIVRGPNNRELFCVYHRWTDAGRVMAIDRLEFAGDRMFVVGATHTPQPLPYPPKKLDRDGHYEKVNDPIAPSFLLELTWVFASPPNDDPAFGLMFETEDGHMTLSIDRTGLTVSSHTGDEMAAPMPPDFAWTAPHLIRIEADQRSLSVRLDSIALPSIVLGSTIRSLTIPRADSSLSISSLELTDGFEELFEDDLPLEQKGWTASGEYQINVKDGEMLLMNTTTLQKAASPGPLEFVANFKVRAKDSHRGKFGLILRDGDRESLKLSVDCEASIISAAIDSLHDYPLPDNISLSQYHQLRVVILDRRALFYFDDVLVAELPGDAHQTHAAVFSEGVPVAIDMIRLTSI